MEDLVSRETLISRYFPERESEIRSYVDLLVGDGVLKGLIGPREGERIWERHIFNSLPVSALIPQGASVIDIGSGAGLPGIPLALARPDISLTLIEPLQRRVDFLIEACAHLPITVLRGRAQDFKIRAEVVTARAVAPFEKLKAMSWHLLDKKGYLLAIKGHTAPAEASLVVGAQVHEIQLEGLELGRVISLQKGA
ncbi:MAG: 16S rRNA (guanine(527)-N(7))-methyltransferase RsmG [Actinobacteria bacterium]|nr:16S rRNA (guanine(527)-N(7))-methyltransferase RsmG [Actinomycetota bacterium]